MMLDNKKIGIKIAEMRKSTGYSQERLADILCISPQAISKWENGHTLPETSLLPVLAQIFSCTIDDIMMPAYTFDEKIESKNMDLQTERIADRVAMKLSEHLKEQKGFSDEAIIDIFARQNPSADSYTIAREKSYKKDGNINTRIIVSSQKKDHVLLERIYARDDTELYRFDFLRQYTSEIPKIYYINYDKKSILMDDLSDHYISGYDFNESNENGAVIRKNCTGLLKSVARFHSDFWENRYALEKIGLEWRLQSRENILAHISTMEKDFQKYRKKQENGKVPAMWEVCGHVLENHIESEQLDYFEDAIQRLKNEYPNLIDSRLNTGQNITLIHGDLHPGSIFMSKDPNRTVKFIGLQAVRMGLCTEDLAMLVALHIAPDQKNAQSLLNYYHQCLCEKVDNYPYEIFLRDYQLSIMENMFFTIKLINHNIFDFNMRDCAIKAFETFILDKA